MMKRYVSIFETAKAMQTMVTRLQPKNKERVKKGLKPITVDRAEHLWKTAEEISKKAGHDKDYAYIMGIWKKMTGYKKKEK